MTIQSINKRVLVAVVVVLVALFWTVDLLRARSYSGANLNFAVGSGSVTVTNPSDTPIAVQLVTSNSRLFKVTSSVEGITGASERVTTASKATQVVYAFNLPAGVTEFTVTSGTDVKFVAETPTKLDAVVQSQSSNEARTTLILGAVVILAALYYMSRATDHNWINKLRGIKPVEFTPLVKIASPASDKGRDLRAYGDNRAPKPE